MFCDTLETAHYPSTMAITLPITGRTQQQCTAINPFHRNRHPPEINYIPKAKLRHVSGTAIDHRWMQPTQVSASPSPLHLSPCTNRTQPSSSVSTCAHSCANYHQQQQPRCTTLRYVIIRGGSYWFPLFTNVFIASRTLQCFLSR